MELLVLEVGKPWKSKVTNGMVTTIKFKDINTNQWYTVFADDTFNIKFHQWMDISKPGNILIGGDVYDLKRKRLSATNIPKFDRVMRQKNEEVNKPEATEEQLPGQLGLL